MVEFTGERVIPGEVNDDLWNEHIARYAFARRYAGGKRVLDAGCGTGYGTAHLAQSARSVTGMDAADDAVSFAARSYSLANTGYLRGSCLQLPFGNGAFDLVVAYEVIEHVGDYRQFLTECARVLDRRGILLVSSPNKRYYAESRGETGPNPFHEHEFEAEEFQVELARVFPAVQLLLQNRTECFAFYPATGWWNADASVESRGGTAQDSHFLIGVCSFEAKLPEQSFVYVMRATNLLRDREQHIRLLETERTANREALHKSLDEHAALVEMFRQQQQELEERNRWAQKLDTDLGAVRQRVAAVQDELAAEQTKARAMVQAYEAKVAELEADNQAKTQWAMETEAHLTAELERTLESLNSKCHELVECVALLDRAEATVTERTLWAQRADTQRAQLQQQLNAVRTSRWVRMGRKIGLGPAIPQP
ncbi:MAG: methyltransferase domain-containing protein [Acidobacteriota bacterium]|nr:methyltransferase domain-containing protein [Acidobacteriota bacterium]